MKNAGTRMVDDLGRLCMPKEIVDAMNLGKMAFELDLYEEVIRGRKIDDDSETEDHEVIRPIDKVGRVVIPKKMRTACGVGPSGAVNISYDRDVIILKAVNPIDVCVGCPHFKGGCNEE